MDRVTNTQMEASRLMLNNWQLNDGAIWLLLKLKARCEVDADFRTRFDDYVRKPSDFAIRDLAEEVGIKWMDESLPMKNRCAHNDAISLLNSNFHLHYYLSNDE